VHLSEGWSARLCEGDPLPKRSGGATHWQGMTARLQGEKANAPQEATLSTLACVRSRGSLEPIAEVVANDPSCTIRAIKSQQPPSSYPRVVSQGSEKVFRRPPSTGPAWIRSQGARARPRRRRVDRIRDDEVCGLGALQ